MRRSSSVSYVSGTTIVLQISAASKLAESTSKYHPTPKRMKDTRIRNYCISVHSTSCTTMLHNFRASRKILQKSKTLESDILPPSRQDAKRRIKRHHPTHSAGCAGATT